MIEILISYWSLCTQIKITIAYSKQRNGLTHMCLSLRLADDISWSHNRPLAYSIHTTTITVSVFSPYTPHSKTKNCRSWLIIIANVGSLCI